MIWQQTNEIPQIASFQNILLVYGTDRLADLSILNSILNEDELAYANRIRSICQRNTWLSCHVTLKRMIGTFLGLKPIEIEFKKNNFGKPFLPDSNLFFNISHTDRSFLLGFNPGGKIGVDLEKLSGREDLESLIDYAFSTTEADYCSAEKRSAHFLEIWTLKEAYLKAKGVGLIDNLKSINVSGNYENEINMKEFNHETFDCPNGETASVVYRNKMSTAYIWLS
jgi:4'-phosphopantetheinyl transferase